MWWITLSCSLRAPVEALCKRRFGMDDERERTKEKD
jgi:hypothetical protein